MNYDQRIGTSNGKDIVVNIPTTGMLPINNTVVRLLYDFHKDAPESYRPLRFINGKPGRYGPTWAPGRTLGQGGYPSTDEAGLLYPYMDFEAAALVAAGVAEYYTGPPVDVDWHGRPLPRWAWPACMVD